MACMGFPEDSDPRDEEPEHECPKCGDILEVENGEAHCRTCDFHHEPEPPEPPDYSNYDGPTPNDNL